jgi:hypothetical protein
MPQVISEEERSSIGGGFNLLNLLLKGVGVLIFVYWCFHAPATLHGYFIGLPTLSEAFAKLPALLLFWSFPLVFAVAMEFHRRVGQGIEGRRAFGFFFRCGLLPLLVPLMLLGSCFFQSEFSPDALAPFSPFTGFAACFSVGCLVVAGLLCFIPNLMGEFPRKSPCLWVGLFSSLPLLWVMACLVMGVFAG